MLKLLFNPASIITVNTNGQNVKREQELGAVDTLNGHSIIIEENKIKDIIPSPSVNKSKFS